MMRILTVQQPAAGAIVALGKDIENRTWITKYKGDVAIHAGAKAMPAAHPFWRFDPYVSASRAAERMQLDALHIFGAIIAVVHVEGVHWGEPGCCDSSWAEQAPFPVHWPLSDLRVLDVPILHTGGLGLRRLDVATERTIRAAIA